MTPEDFLSSSAWIVRMKTYFKLMDVNGDGVLSLSDYETIAARFVKLQDNSSNSEVIRTLFHDLFQNFLAGGGAVDTNTMIGEEEFITNAAKAVTVLESSREVGEKKNEVFFDLIDTDDSGQISREEYRKYLAIYSGEDQPERAYKAFESLDADGDGSITRAEFIEGHMGYWCTLPRDQTDGPLPYGPLIDT
ncbi:EF-hand domain-containing protein [Moorena bouillonii]|nr:EF-hand domain-containing protein [Moorena bouillonii]